MFDPRKYFGEIERVLSDRTDQSLCTVTSSPSLSWTHDSQAQWTVIVWRIEVNFPQGYKLIALESHERRRGVHYRKIKYRLMKDDGELVFMVDTHQDSIPFQDTPHLHRGPTEKNRLSEGDWELGDTTLRDFDFLKMLEWTQRYLEDGRLPWRQ